MALAGRNGKRGSNFWDPGMKWWKLGLRLNSFGSGKKWSNSGGIWKIEPILSVSGLDVEHDGNRGIKGDS